MLQSSFYAITRKIGRDVPFEAEPINLLSISVGVTALLHFRLLTTVVAEDTVESPWILKTSTLTLLKDSKETYGFGDLA